MSERLNSDPLSTIVTLLRPQTVLSKLVTGNGRWAVQYPSYGQPSFGLVLEGTFWFTPEGDEPMVLEPGDVLVVPSTPAFVLASHQSVREPPTQRVPDPSAGDVHHGKADGEITHRMLGGYFLFDSTNAPLLVGLLPKVVLVKASDVGADRLSWIARAIGEETTAQRPGRESVLVRLAEIMLIEALRWRPTQASVPLAGLLAGLDDARLAKALRLVHQDVARRWTVDGLAQAAGMSRAAFAAAFAQVLGTPPMDYLLRWRMAVAKDVLSRTDTPLAELAATVGYQSASAFSAAFRRCVGVPPSSFARRHVTASELHGGG